jgi:hypothetical protein
MKELGYDEAEALMLAKHQSWAIFFALFGNLVFVLVVSSFVRH